LNYLVQWSKPALNVVTSAWLNSPSDRRAAITKATAEIERVLAINPAEQGESREGSDRVLFVPPLAIDFEVNESRRVVRILKVREMKSVR
jgi:hypothetical protein